MLTAAADDRRRHRPGCGHARPTIRCAGYELIDWSHELRQNLVLVLERESTIPLEGTATTSPVPPPSNRGSTG